VVNLAQVEAQAEAQSQVEAQAKITPVVMEAANLAQLEALVQAEAPALDQVANYPVSLATQHTDKLEVWVKLEPVVTVDTEWETNNLDKDLHNTVLVPPRRHKIVAVVLIMDLAMPDEDIPLVYLVTDKVGSAINNP